MTHIKIRSGCSLAERGFVSVHTVTIISKESGAEMNAPRFFYLPTTSLCRFTTSNRWQRRILCRAARSSRTSETGDSICVFPRWESTLRLSICIPRICSVFSTTCLPFPMLFSGMACLPSGSTPSRRSGTLTRGEHPDVVTHGILTGSGATATRGARLYK